MENDDEAREAIRAAGITDEEGVELTLHAYRRDRGAPPIGDWLAQRDALPKGVRAYLPRSAKSNQVKVGKRTVELVVPTDYEICADIFTASAINFQRALAAALGVCWSDRSLGRPKIRYAQCHHSALEYGGRVINELHEHGVPLKDVLAAGAVAFDLVTAQVVTEDEVEDAVGNSEAPAGG